MLVLIRLTLLRLLQSERVKMLVIELLEAYAKTSDNTIDDKIVDFVKINLFPSKRIDK